MQTQPAPHPRWDLPNTDATNESFFSGFPGGRLNWLSEFDGKGTQSYWWSSSPVLTNKIWFYSRSLNTDD